jgi:hypothetical protein
VFLSFVWAETDAATRGLREAFSRPRPLEA